MRKLMMLAAMLALVAVVAVPAFAQVEQEFGQETESGDVELANEVSNEGDNSNVCAPTEQFANTGNLQNAQGFAQYGSETGDIEFGGSEFVAEPSLESECEQTIEQAATATSTPDFTPPGLTLEELETLALISACRAEITSAPFILGPSCTELLLRAGAAGLEFIFPPQLVDE